MARRIKINAVTPTLAGTAGNDTIVGRNQDLNEPGDVLDGGAGDDVLNPLQGADTLTGGAGSDTFHMDSWAASNELYGVDDITDFEPNDKIDVAGIKNYSGPDHMTVRPVNWGDVTLTPIIGGNLLRIAVWQGDPTWDLVLRVFGATPTQSNMVFG